MATREHVITEDPTVTDAIDVDGDNYADDAPEGDYQALTIETPSGEATGVSLGQALFDGGENHGEVTRIVNHGDDAEGHSWRWTVYFNYTDGSEGGVPLGELAAQLDEGARLVA